MTLRAQETQGTLWIQKKMLLPELSQALQIYEPQVKFTAPMWNTPFFKNDLYNIVWVFPSGRHSLGTSRTAQEAIVVADF